MLKIPLKPDAKPIKQHPYRLNPNYKEKVRMKLEKMLIARISEVVQENLSWYTDVSKVPIVVKLKLVVVPKKKGVSNPKMRPLGKIRLGGVSMLTTLTTCNNEILGNLAPFGQDLCQILCL